MVPRGMVEGNTDTVVSSLCRMRPALASCPASRCAKMVVVHQSAGGGDHWTADDHQSNGEAPHQKCLLRAMRRTTARQAMRRAAVWCWSQSVFYPHCGFLPLTCLKIMRKIENKG